jgi:hypothetical protein
VDIGRRVIILRGEDNGRHGETLVKIWLTVQWIKRNLVYRCQ